MMMTSVCDAGDSGVWFLFRQGILFDRCRERGLRGARYQRFGKIGMEKGRRFYHVFEIEDMLDFIYQ